MIAAPIRWIGLADPLNARVTEDESADEDKLHAHAMIGALESIGTPVSSKALLTALYPRDFYETPDPVDPHPTFAPAREAIEAATKAKGVPSAALVGTFLRSLKGRVVDGRAIKSEQHPHSKASLWSVSRVS